MCQSALIFDIFVHKSDKSAVCHTEGPQTKKTDFQIILYKSYQSVTAKGLTQLD